MKSEDDFEDLDAFEFYRSTEFCRAWLKGKTPAHWIWLAQWYTGEHGESHDERGIRDWIERQPEYSAAIDAACTQVEIDAAGSAMKPYSDAASYDLFNNRFTLARDVPRPGTSEWRMWWKKVGGDPERYWANEPLFGYPESLLGHVARWTFAAACVAVILWGVWAFYGLKAG